MEGQGEEKGKRGGEVKTPKGTRDYGPEEMKIREEVLGKIVKVFKQHGAVAIETPVFELKEVLLGSYGEDEKLIFDLAEQGGESCALRYDLTVPFSRFVAMNNVKQIKKYQIGRVYRRDQPHMKGGRYREFYQCDFDIAGGEYGAMIPDAECLCIMRSILASLDIGAFAIKVNHRGLLDGIFAVCGVPANLFVPICSAVDKLDKAAWPEVRAEMTLKGLPEEAADRIWSFVSIRGSSAEVVAKLRADAALMANEHAVAAVADLEKLFSYLTALEADAQCILDLSLARGLSYYTGVIFEAVLTDSKVHVGSVGGGGRYDKLVGRFKKKGDIPCVGFSVGVERLFTVMQEIRKSQNTASRSNTLALVCSIESGALLERMALAAELWEAGIAAELVLKDAPKIQAQLKFAETQQIPFAVIFGPDEWRDNTVKVKDMANSQQDVVPRAELAAYLRAKQP